MNKLLISAILLIFAFSACSKEDALVSPQNDLSSDQAAISKIIEEDEAILSFEPNFNEDDLMTFFGKVTQEIFPVRVGQRMILTDKIVEVNTVGDSSFVKVTKIFYGTLFIAASYDEFSPGDFNVIDTLIQKEFTSRVTRNVLMIKVAETEDPFLNWRIKAISLPEAEMIENDEVSNNIQINKMTITFQDGEIIDVTNPNEYYLSRMPGFANQIPVFRRGEEISINIELQSAYEDTDFVSVTWGGIHRMPHNLNKRKMDLLSSEFDGVYYKKVYQQTFTTHFIPGFRHAVINATPKQVVFDDSTMVEQNSWGIPYAVH